MQAVTTHVVQKKHIQYMTYYMFNIVYTPKLTPAHLHTALRFTESCTYSKFIVSRLEEARSQSCLDTYGYFKIEK